MKVKRFCDIIKENDNLDKSYNSMSKFGLGYDPNKIFRPNFLLKTRSEIAHEMLISYYKSEGKDFYDLDEELQDKMINDFNQLLNDEECQKYVNDICHIFEMSVSDSYMAEAEENLSRSMINNKKFDTKKYEN